MENKKEIRESKKLGDSIELTKEGVRELKDKLNELINVERPQIVKLLQEAREQGDLSENADYDSAKNQQAEIEAEIIRIEDILSRVRIISDRKSESKVILGSNVEYKNLKTNEKIKIRIVGKIEYDSFADVKKISINSPLAKSIVGKKTGEECFVESPNPYKVKILKIS